MSGVVYTEIAPAALLADVVRCYWSIEGVVPVGGGVANRVLPDGCIDVIFNLGEAPTGAIGTLPEPGSVVGAMLEAFVVDMRGRVDVVGVRFEPGAAGAYLGIPATELTARSVGLTDVRRDASHIADRIRESGDLASRGFGSGGMLAGAARRAQARLRARASVLDTALAGAAVAPRDPLAIEAARLIQRSDGAIAVAELEHRLAVSARTLTRRFAAAVGLTPKMACRVARLQAAAAHVRSDPTASLARIAVRAGYHDQPHLNRDFRALAGVTPAGYAREARDGFIQDEPRPSA